MTLTFRLASYNILANAYAKPERYAHIEPDVLLWEPRKRALLANMESFDADIVCLQEVEADAYALFARGLEEKGYTGLYAPKGHEKPDGCATFFRQEALRFTGSETLYYHDGSPGIPSSDHLALIASFTCALGSIRVANTHLRWDRADKPPEEHLGYREIQEWLDSYVHRDAATFAWVLCGDLNASPGSPVVRALLANGFADAYAGHEQNTCNPNRKAKRIDYLFHTKSLRSMPDPLREIEDRTPLPSHEEPSDHLAVMATFVRA